MTAYRRLMIRVNCVLLGWVLCCGAALAQVQFKDVTASSGIQYKNICGAALGEKGWLAESMGAGAAWLDYDGDGNLDLYLVNGSTYERKAGAGEPNQLYRGDGKGNFRDVTDKAGVGDRGWGYGASVGDFDNDGHPDLYVTNFGPNVLYRNRGDGTFEDVTRKAKVGDPSFSSSAAFFDMDRDGDLDLYVGNYMMSDPKRVPRRGSPEAVEADCHFQGIAVACGPLGQTPLQDVLYRNNGNGTFSDVTAEAGVKLDLPRFTLGVVSGDYDNDGDTDLYVANDSVQNSLWQNQGNGKFVDVGVGSLAGLNVDGRAQAGMGTDFGDYSGDGWLDIVVTNFSQDYNTVYRNLGGKFFLDDSANAGLTVTQLALSWGTAFYDFDLDADLDLFIANGHVYPEVDNYQGANQFRQANHLFLNNGGKFGMAPSSGGLSVRRSYRGAAFGDYDNDGDIDIALTSLQESAVLLRNDTPAKGHRLQIQLRGTRSNADGIGARVTLRSGGKSQVRERKGGGSYLSASDPRLHFGLGQAATVEALEVRWPSGQIDRLAGVKANQLVVITEGQSSRK